MAITKCLIAPQRSSRPLFCAGATAALHNGAEVAAGAAASWRQRGATRVLFAAPLLRARHRRRPRRGRRLGRLRRRCRSGRCLALAGKRPHTSKSNSTQFSCPDKELKRFPLWLCHYCADCISSQTPATFPLDDLKLATGQCDVEEGLGYDEGTALPGHHSQGDQPKHHMSFCPRQGAEGAPLDGAALRRMEAFLSAAAPRVRVLGGTRFDGAGAPAPEWAAFGSYCFLLPRLELLEASGCCLLSCTLAWRESVGSSEKCASVAFFLTATMRILGQGASVRSSFHKSFSYLALCNRFLGTRSYCRSPAQLLSRLVGRLAGFCSFLWTSVFY